MSDSKLATSYLDILAMISRLKGSSILFSLIFLMDSEASNYAILFSDYLVLTFKYLSVC